MYGSWNTGKMKHNKIKIFITIAILLIIFFSLFFLLQIAKQGKTMQQYPGSITNQESTNSTVPPYPNLVPITDKELPIPPGGWILGNNDKYTVLFPSTLQPATLAVVGGGTNTILYPVAQSGQHYPEFTIEASPTDPNDSIEDRITTIKSIPPFNLSVVQTTYRGLPATQVSEVIPNPVGHNRLNKTFLFFTDNGYTYVVDFAYIQDQNAAKNEQMLLQITNSLTLK